MKWKGVLNSLGGWHFTPTPSPPFFLLGRVPFRIICTSPQLPLNNYSIALLSPFSAVVYFLKYLFPFFDFCFSSLSLCTSCFPDNRQTLILSLANRIESTKNKCHFLSYCIILKLSSLFSSLFITFWEMKICRKTTNRYKIIALNVSRDTSRRS